jgi:hypothetical protein
VDGFRLTGSRPPGDALQDAERAISAALAAGLEAVAVVPLAPKSRALLPIFLMPGGVSAGRAVALARSALSVWRAASGARLGDFRRPAVLTHELWRIGCLLEPVPFVGAGLAAPIAGAGRLPEPPRAPARAELESMVRTACVDGLTRLRGRSMRLLTGHHRAALELDLDHWLPAMEQLLRDGTIALDWISPIHAPRVISEEDIVRRCRDWSERVRALYASAMRERLALSVPIAAAGMPP